MQRTVGIQSVSDNRIDINAKIAFTDFDIDISESFPLDGCTAIFGPSGAGKSTLIRLIAGLSRPDKGRIVWRDDIWCDTQTNIFIPPHQRGAGVVFQDGRLFPHLSVEKNLHYADKRSAGDASQIRFDNVVSAFDLSSLLSRDPRALSGGERQRVAIARTLLSRPKLLLLDEPLSALDRSRKAEILPYLDDISERFELPVIYVSHNIAEITRLADRTLILRDGRARAIGATAEVLNEYGAVTESDEKFALLQGVVSAHDAAYQLTTVAIGGGEISMPMNKKQSIGDKVVIRVGARDVAISKTCPDAISIRNVLPATIAKFECGANSPFSIVTLDCSGSQISAQVTRAAINDLGLDIGQSVFALVKSASFDA